MAKPGAFMRQRRRRGALSGAGGRGEGDQGEEGVLCEELGRQNGCFPGGRNSG